MVFHFYDVPLSCKEVQPFLKRKENNCLPQDEEEK
jgi:hypothetical protein